MLVGFLLCLWALPAARAEPTAEAAREIAWMLDLIRHSDCTFIRNGSDYAGPAAADHVQAKYEHYRKEIFSAEDFIAKAASKSLLTGKPYQVRCPDTATVPAADWLHAALARYRAPGATGNGS